MKKINEVSSYAYDFFANRVRWASYTRYIIMLRIFAEPVCQKLKKMVDS